MHKRYVEFDALRVVALGMILICHFIRTVGFHRLDIPFGCIGNMIFFVISGWLLGLAWGNKGYPQYGRRFLVWRILRLAVPLWLFAVPYMTYLKAIGYHISIKDVILNLTLLNWFDRLPGMTPYWFITGIASFYVVVLFMSRVRNVVHRPVSSSFMIIGMAIAVQCLLSLNGIRYGYFLIMIAVGLLCFLNAKKIYDGFLQYIHISSMLSAAVAILLLLCYWLGVTHNSIVVGTPICYYATIPVALFITTMVFSLPRTIQANKIVEFISSISYEVYLVHSAMLLFMKPLSSNSLMYAALFLVGTFALAIPLHLASISVFRLTGLQK